MAGAPEKIEAPTVELGNIKQSSNFPGFKSQDLIRIRCGEVIRCAKAAH